MDSRAFAESIEKQVAEFCKTLDAKLPAYSYIPLAADTARIKVMQSRLFNEIRAGEIFGGWLKSTPELDVKKTLAEAVHERVAECVVRLRKQFADLSVGHQEPAHLGGLA